ncbi:hypothetical protein K461DRAFT_291100 [Myriangium duriaei CBS 260.36]|uniref:CENP-C homolog n=1 Tax=Myriangium duriaei CBS 260.36 TaxID=1168546 RepID=A0A9P4JC58_9PEZI|nr:hypothetical protein K461DRAFT_291100 [Myriangium duriaei CBS 260.36]
MQSQSRTPGRNTPGRRRNANKENVYFEPGKYGRKTGLTLKDTGVRDEHGFEPVSGIFSSPHHETPERPPLGRKTRNSTIAEAATLEARRTPRIPPPRSQTPRRTNIGGSPVRHSAVKQGSPLRGHEDDVTPTRARSAQPDDEIEHVVNSIERPTESVEVKKSAKAQGKRMRKSIFEFNLSPEKPVASSPAAHVIEEVSQILDTGDSQPLHDSHFADEHSGQEDSLPDMSAGNLESTSVHAQSNHAHIDEPNTKRKRGARRSDVSQKSVDDQQEPRTTSSSKRRRTGNVSIVEPSPSQRLSSRQSDVSLPFREEEPHMDTFGDDQPLELGTDEEDEQNEEQEEEDEVEEEVDGEVEEQDGIQQEDDEEESEGSEPPVATSAARGGKKRGRKSVGLKRKQAKDKQTAARSVPRARTVANRDPHADDEEGTTIRGAIRLRSATPFDDPDMHVTRSGRASVKPLAFWKNETFVYDHGEVQGIIRAEELPPTKRQKSKPKRKTRKGLARIDEDDEEDMPEDLLAEAWEEETGIITGRVRAWDSEVDAGSLDMEESQDVGFAARAIETQEVAGGSFRYAKVLTLPFFGAGVLEIPPEGEKRLKNCRKMQMVFFVHEGKVTVDVAGMEFGVTQGGMWQVPRGNNYSLKNESTMFPAKVFFAQGCETDTQAVTEESQT